MVYHKFWAAFYSGGGFYVMLRLETVKPGNPGIHTYDFMSSTGALSVYLSSPVELMFDQGDELKFNSS